MPRLGSALAIQFIMAVLPPIFALPIADAIHTDTVHSLGLPDGNNLRSWRYVTVFSGVCSMVASVLLASVRFRLQSKPFKAV